jgi:ribosomal protein S1
MKKKKELIKQPKFQIKVGDIVEGEVIKIKRGEIWVDLNGLATGVIHKNEFNEEKKVKLGEKIRAKVIEEENEEGLIELSLKEISSLEIWENLKKIKESGEIVKVKVIDANRGGLIVSFKNLSGFIPSSQLASNHYPQVEDKDKEKILSLLKGLVGQTLEVKIIDVDETTKKLIFSEKEVEIEKKKSFLEKYKINEIIEGEVVGINPFGVLVKIDNQIDGFIHISELSWQKVDEIKNFVKIGEKIKAKIISIDNSKIYLSVKRLTKDPWQEIERKYQVGKKVKGKILKITPYGVLVEIEKGIQGLAHISEIPQTLFKNKKIKVGEILNFKIISLEPEDHRLGLSLK